jgi:uncharacterized protein (DUF2062 family)
MFRRRNKLPLSRRFRELFWPSIGFRRSTRYLMHRVGRIPGTPSSIALGFAIGVGIAITPFVGLHLAIAVLIAWLIGASPLAAAIGTLTANPWTIPFIMLGIYRLGARMLGEGSHHHLPRNASFFYLLHHPLQVLLPMVLGSIPVSIGAGVISFFAARALVARYHRRRRQRQGHAPARRRRGEEKP